MEKNTYWDDRTDKAMLTKIDAKNKTNERQPDYKIEGNIGGHVFDIAGWESTNKRGEKTISIQLSSLTKVLKSISGSSKLDIVTEKDEDIPF
tara:strand:+ start:317 stop:592 length:276 start_codon:yes stop_codon:yes gene_type:complete